MIDINKFYEKCLTDKHIKPSHISIYMALLLLYTLNRNSNPIHIYRKDLMQLSKINSITTYHKCIKYLHEKAYITYKPSFNPYKSSMVIITEH
jgi:hypothetical protein